MEISKVAGSTKYTRASEGELLKPMFIFINPSRINFSVPVGTKIGIEQGNRIAIFKLGEDWFMAKTNETDGYLISDQGRHSLSFTATLVCRQIFKIFGRTALLERTNYEYHQNKVWKLVKRIM